MENLNYGNELATIIHSSIEIFNFMQNKKHISFKITKHYTNADFENMIFTFYKFKCYEFAK